MQDATPAGNVRKGRFWLYAPFVLLLLVAVAWSIAWFVIRARTQETLDAWLAAEARDGRQWACTDRQIQGFPFRIELTCDALTLRHGPVTASFGRTEAVAQVYQPRRVILGVAGPLRVSDGTATVQAAWDLLQASVHASQTGLQRLSVAAKAPKLAVMGLGPGEIASSAESMELHVRPNPSRTAESAYDVATSIRQARIPLIDAILDGAEATDLAADVTVTKIADYGGRPIAEELERWRAADGSLEILMMSLAKGSRHLEAKGALRIDEAHRPAGRLDVAAAGLGGLLNDLTGGGIGGNLLGALLGQNRPAAANRPGGTKPQLSPLPPLRFENGLVALGPFVIPDVRLKPLY